MCVRVTVKEAREISAPVRKILRDEYGGQVPDDFDALLKLPVSQKRNLIAGDVFGKPAIVTDTHCILSGKQNRYCGWHQGAKKVDELGNWCRSERGSSFANVLFIMAGCPYKEQKPPDKCCLVDSVKKRGLTINKEENAINYQYTLFSGCRFSSFTVFGWVWRAAMFP